MTTRARAPADPLPSPPSSNREVVSDDLNNTNNRSREASVEGEDRFLDSLEFEQGSSSDYQSYQSLLDQEFPSSLNFGT